MIPEVFLKYKPPQMKADFISRFGHRQLEREEQRNGFLVYLSNLISFAVTELTIQRIFNDDTNKIN